MLLHIKDPSFHWLRCSELSHLKVYFCLKSKSLLISGGGEVVGGIIIAITLRYQKAPGELTGPALAGGSGSEKLQSWLRQHRNYNSHTAHWEQVSSRWGGNIKQFSSLCQPPAGVYYCLTIPNHVNFPLNLKQQIKLRKTICQEALVVQQRRSEWPRCRWCPARRAAGWGQSSPLRTTGISPAPSQCSPRLVRGEGRSEVRWGRSDKLRHCFNIQQGDRRGPNILNIHRWYESFWFQLVFWPGKIRCKSLKCDLSPEVKLSKIPFSVVLINDS